MTLCCSSPTLPWTRVIRGTRRASVRRTLLYAGPGKTATGHCELEFATGLGECTLSGGTRTLDGIRARVDVSYLGGYDWAWDGTYRLREDD